MLMKGVYGELQPKAEIRSGFNDWFIRPIFIHNLPEISTDGSEANAVQAMENLGFSCTKIHDFRGDYYECIHAETAKAMEVEKAEKSIEDARWSASAERGYVRFGKSPKSGHSRNYRDGFQEKGVSCYNALFIGREYRLVLNEAQKSQLYTYTSGRDAYRLWGEVVGTGSDGEPLLNVKREEKI